MSPKILVIESKTVDKGQPTSIMCLSACVPAPSGSWTEKIKIA